MSTTARPGPALPPGVVFERRDFPNSNLLLLLGDEPALVDTGFVAFAGQTATLAEAHTSRVSKVVNTHWHSDHVGGNALFQRRGTEIVGAKNEAAALLRADPGCCVAERLDQPVPQYTIDSPVTDGDRVRLGDSRWDIVAAPGHTPDSIAFWEPERRILAVGDALSSYDAGWVDVMAHGPELLDRAASSLSQLRELDARVVFPGHGPAIGDPVPAIEKALQRIERQREDIERAVYYGAKRILAFALIIRGGMAFDALEEYLSERDWARDAADLLGITTSQFARALVDPMLSSGALTITGGRIRAAQESREVAPMIWDLPFPREWAAPEAPHSWSAKVR